MEQQLFQNLFSFDKAVQKNHPALFDDNWPQVNL